MNKNLIFFGLIILNLLFIASCKKQKATPEIVVQQSAVESFGDNITKQDIHWYLKVAFFFITGIAFGVYFEAKIQIKNIFRPIVEVTMYGFLIAVVVYSMFSLNEFFHIF